MHLDDSIIALFHAQLSNSGESPVIEVPEQEIEVGLLDDETTYRVAVIEQEQIDETDGEGTLDRSSNFEPRQPDTSPKQQDGPPVSEGDRRQVTIEGVGEEGDGMAKIDGYTVFVPGSKVDETLQVEIVKARSRFAFAKPVDGSEKRDAPA